MTLFRGEREKEIFNRQKNYTKEECVSLLNSIILLFNFMGTLKLSNSLNLYRFQLWKIKESLTRRDIGIYYKDNSNGITIQSMIIVMMMMMLCKHETHENFSHHRRWVLSGHRRIVHRQLSDTSKEQHRRKRIFWSEI